MELITAYLVGIVAFIGLFAIRVPHEDVRIVFILGMFWPVSILSILVVLILNVTGWDMDMAKGTKVIGFRKPGNPQIKGFAFTVLFQEFQFFKMR